MGLYSDNRVNYEASSIDISNSSVGIHHLMESTLQICESEQSMFDFLIECDMLETMNGKIMNEEEAASTNDSNNEKKNGTIIDKIKSIFKFIIEGIKKIAGKISDKLKQLMSKDGALVDKYQDKLTAENLKDFPAIDELFNFKQYRNYIDELNKASVDANLIINLIKGDKSSAQSKADEINGKLQETQKAINVVKEKMQNNMLKNWKPGDADIKYICNRLKNKEGNDKYLAYAKSKLANVEQLNKTAETLHGGEKGADEHLNIIYKTITEFSKVQNLQFSTISDCVVKSYGACRKCFLMMVKHINNGGGNKEEKSEEQTKQENASIFMVGEMSDMFIESVFYV